MRYFFLPLAVSMAMETKIRQINALSTQDTRQVAIV